MYIYIYRLGMPLNSPCRDFVTRWNGGACPPAWNGPWLPIGVLWVTNLGPWQHAWPSGVCMGLGAGIKALFPCRLPSGGLRGCRGRRSKFWPCSLGDSLGAVPCMLNSCCDRVGTRECV